MTDDFERTPLSEVLAAFRFGWRIVGAATDMDGAAVWVLGLERSPTRLYLAVPAEWTLIS